MSCNQIGNHSRKNYALDLRINEKYRGITLIKSICNHAIGRNYPVVITLESEFSNKNFQYIKHESDTKPSIALSLS